MAKFPDIDWYCDECDEYMNSQAGFDDSLGTWTCTECGYENSITSDDILFSSNNSEEDDSERLSVYDAADIWASNGKDEDYTFGYTEEELEDAL